MEKRKFYVSVQAGTILENQGDSAYEFVIEATSENIDKLQQLFEKKMEDDQAMSFRSITPGLPYHLDDNNDYDDTLKDIYSMISKLGTKETSDHIARMDLHHIENW